MSERPKHIVQSFEAALHELKNDVLMMLALRTGLLTALEDLSAIYIGQNPRWTSSLRI